MVARALAGRSQVSELDKRKDYGRYRLLKETANADPFEQFREWLRDAAETAAIEEPNAMTLATAGANCKPSARVVLLRGYDERGVVFYTNYLSRKGLELAENPAVALVFFWAPLERQVRIEGDASRIDENESDRYFASRPYKSRLGTLASPQSSVIANRAVLEQRMAELERAYPEGTVVPRPEHWGGYRVRPDMFEFWQGGANRLHDRLLYRRGNKTDDWTVERLAP